MHDTSRPSSVCAQTIRLTLDANTVSMHVRGTLRCCKNVGRTYDFGFASVLEALQPVADYFVVGHYWWCTLDTERKANFTEERWLRFVITIFYGSRLLKLLRMTWFDCSGSWRRSLRRVDLGRSDDGGGGGGDGGGVADS